LPVHVILLHRTTVVRLRDSSGVSTAVRLGASQLLPMLVFHAAMHLWS